MVVLLHFQKILTKISVILIEKALAKLYGSYENLRNAPAD
jgi:hypothetical protein